MITVNRAKIGWTIAAMLALAVFLCVPAAHAETYKYFSTAGITLKIADDGSIYMYDYNDTGWHTRQEWSTSTDIFKQYLYGTGWALQGYKYIDPNGHTLYTDAATPSRSVEEFTNDRPFYKGGNLPWLEYGHDFGSQSSGSGLSVGDHEGALINKLNQFAGRIINSYIWIGYIFFTFII